MGYQAYLACPTHNKVQVAQSEKLEAVFDRAGFDTYGSWEVATEDLDGTPIPEKAQVQSRLEGLLASDIVFAWLDQLLPPGVQWYALTNIERQLSVPIPPEYKGLIAAGLQVTGMNAQEEGGILLPGGGSSKQRSLVPEAIKLGLKDGGVVGTTLGGPINCPNTDVAFEVGYAVFANKPIIALGLAVPSCGQLVSNINHLTPTLFLPSVKAVEKALPRVLDGLGGTVACMEELFGELHSEAEADLAQELAAQKAKE